MSLRSWLLISLVLIAALPALSVSADDEASKITWKKTVVDKTFRSEGVAVADVNKDGKLDILVGDYWYEAPDWKPHEIRKPGNFGDGAGGYSQCFACWADDVNGDGWPDLVVVGFPGAPCHWYENPQGKEGHWKQHVICESACNETPTYVDLFGNGKRALVMGFKEKQMVWVAPGKDPTQPWEVHSISDPQVKAPGSAKFDHGLGVGDVNGDKRLDVITTGGWWEQPEKDVDKPWKFHPANLGPSCADMYAFDMDGDGKADILSSSAHDEGIWWHQQKPGKDDNPTFVRQVLFKDIFSQSHAMQFVDINGDGLKDLVTGKRWWAHGPKGDKNPMADPVLYWFEQKKAKDGVVTFVPHKIDEASGIGTQFWVGDFNGDKLPDIVISNKRGVFLFEQVKK
ncbi:MAG: VCBS repeat-containing protein [Gemmataceae bacterium]|nr:VCBS repeat-containing protein [Gemmataceae bacterium]